MKKLLLGIVVLAFVCGALSAMGTPDDDQDAVQVRPGPFGKYDPPIDVTFVANVDDNAQQNLFQNEMDYETNLWVDAYREILGVNLEYLWITRSGEEYTQKFNLMIASGEMPDVVTIWQGNESVLKRMVEAETVQPIGHLFEEYLEPHALNNIVYSTDKLHLQPVTIDGDIWALPQYMELPGEGAQSFLFIRKDWLDNLGLEIPTTMQELLSVAEAFTLNDPDGNGEDDTYGIMLTTDVLDGLTSLASGYHVYPNIWVEQGNELVYGATVPEVKDFLGVIRDLFARGITDQEFSTRASGGDQYVQDIAAGRVGIVPGVYWNPLWPLQDTITNNPEADYLPLMLVSVDDRPAMPSGRYLGNLSIYAVNAEYQYPEVPLKMTNVFVDLYDNQFETYGIQTNEDGSTWPTWNLSPISHIIPGLNLNTHKAIIAAKETGDTSGFSSEEQSMYDYSESYLAGNRGDWGWYRIFAAEGPNFTTEAGLVHYYENDLIYFNKFQGIPTDTMLDRWATLEELVTEVFIKIIIGDEELDRFDTFVEDWYAQGGDQITQEVNEWYEGNR